MMAKSDPIERALDRLGELRHAQPKEQAVKELREALRNRSNLVVAKAARVARELRVAALVPEMVAAFDRLMANAPKLDKRCAATTELISAMYELDYDEPLPYLKGLRHVQLEGSYGPPVDEAAKLRALSAQGLLRTPYSEALAEVTSLLVDPEPAARAGAIRALSANGGETGLLLLRLKVLTGDPELAVLAECFCALLSSGGDRSVAFVARYIDAADEAIAESAILALGESRLPAAFSVLKEKWGRTAAASVRVFLLAALAASRLDEAVDFLIGVIETASHATARDALEALSIYRHNPRIAQAVQQAVHARNEKLLTDAFTQNFTN
jgi:hypothetical protein